MMLGTYKSILFLPRGWGPKMAGGVEWEGLRGLCTENHLSLSPTTPPKAAGRSLFGGVILRMQFLTFLRGKRTISESWWGRASKGASIVQFNSIHCLSPTSTTTSISRKHQKWFQRWGDEDAFHNRQLWKNRVKYYSTREKLWAIFLERWVVD